MTMVKKVEMVKRKMIRRKALMVIRRKSQKLKLMKAVLVGIMS